MLGRRVPCLEGYAFQGIIRHSHKPFGGLQTRKACLFLKTRAHLAETSLECAVGQPDVAGRIADADRRRTMERFPKGANYTLLTEAGRSNAFQTVEEPGLIHTDPGERRSRIHKGASCETWVHPQKTVSGDHTALPLRSDDNLALGCPAPPPVPLVQSPRELPENTKVDTIKPSDVDNASPCRHATGDVQGSGKHIDIRVAGTPP